MAAAFYGNKMLLNKMKVKAPASFLSLLEARSKLGWNTMGFAVAGRQLKIVKYFVQNLSVEELS